MLVRRAVAGWFGVAFLVGLLMHCDRRPEPDPPANARARANRCMRATPTEPPAPVAPGPDPSCPKDPDGGPPKVPMGKVTFSEAQNTPSVEVETMLTEERRARGLMYRKEMAEDHGMIFVFDDVAPRTFWMHNTCLPLDMLFIAPDGFIAGILENVPTMNDDGRSNPCAVKYVLEVNAGYSRRHGIKAGQKVKLDLP